MSLKSKGDRAIIKLPSIKNSKSPKSVDEANGRFGVGMEKLITSMFFCAHPINGVLVNYKNAPQLRPRWSLPLIPAPHSFCEGIRESGHAANRASGWSGCWSPCCVMSSSSPFHSTSRPSCGSWKIKTEGHREGTGLARRGHGTLFILSNNLFQPKHQCHQSGSVRMTSIFFTFLATYAKLIGWYVSETCFAGRHCPDLAYAGGTKFAGRLGVELELGDSPGRGCLAMDKISTTQPGLICHILILTGFLPVVPACLSRLEFGVIIEPHWLIFSSIGYFLLLAIVFSRLQRPRQQKDLVLRDSGPSLFYVSSSRHYNYLWGSNKILPLLAHGIAGSLLAEFLAGIRLLGGQEL